MKVKVTNKIPGKKAKDGAPTNPVPETSTEVAKAGEAPADDAIQENRENPDDRHREAEARKAFDAGIRSKLKYSRKR
jgi:hypothetical protein